MGELDFRLHDILIYVSRIEQNIWRRKLFFCRGEEKRRRNIIFFAKEKRKGKGGKELEKEKGENIMDREKLARDHCTYGF